MIFMKKLLIPLLLICIFIQNCSDKTPLETEPMSIKSYIEANEGKPQSETSQYLRSGSDRTNQPGEQSTVSRVRAQYVTQLDLRKLSNPYKA